LIYSRISLHDAGGIGKHLDHGATLPPPKLPRRSGDRGRHKKRLTLLPNLL
jgi:hypothetical protein